MPDVIDRDPLLNIDQVSERLNTSRRTIYRLIDSGDLQKLKIRNQTRFAQSAVDALIRRMTELDA